MKLATSAAGALVGVALWTSVSAQQPAPRDTGIKYVRDSEEYAALTRQVYRVAALSVGRYASGAHDETWAVVLDVDETALDNSTYQLERAAYGLAFDEPSWRAWVNRREASAIPGVMDFIDIVRRAGGHVGWITNRDAALAEATRANLKFVGLWTDDDRLCTRKTPQHTKAIRRRELVTGKGDCAWAGAPRRVVAFVGDQLGDFPGASEQIPETGTDEAFGRTCFLLPNPMYGLWTTEVTRTSVFR
jgi:5'-nucleotidase (lipoprotein e(P4) family)